METDSVLQFYGELAGDYHMIFPDWKATVQRQGDTLDRFIRRELAHVDDDTRLLDCSCGIGTQAIGLAERGYRVHATDISPQAVRRAAYEAEISGIPVTFGIADMRELESAVDGEFDVVLSCDNALAHMLTYDDLHAAAMGMASKLRSKGLLLASIRDYDTLVTEKPNANGPLIYNDPEGKRIFFQVWDWAADGSSYTLHHFITHEAGGEWQNRHAVTTLRALLRDDVGGALYAAGFSDVRWHMPEQTGYYQPIVTARKR